jgi:hypothetical protein
MARSSDISTQKLGLLSRLSFVQNLFEPNKDKKTGKPKNYGVTALFDKALDLSPLHNLAVEAATEEWGEKAVQMIKDGIIKSPFLDGDGKQGKSKETGEPHKGYPGHTFIRCTSGLDYPPRVVMSKNGAVVPAMKQDIKSGDYGYLVINAYTWDNTENGKGITFGVSMVMKAKDGESLGGAGGSGNPDEHFEAIPDEGAAPKETQDGKGAAGLFG